MKFAWDISEKYSGKFLGKLGFFTYIVFMNRTTRIDVNHVGKKYGLLTVKKFSHRKTYDNKHYSSKKYWSCSCECGGEITVETSSLTGGRTKSCGCLRKKTNNGYGKIDKNGYRSVYVKEHKKYILEHRYIYEKHYGVNLESNQNIHHINGDRLDNRIENLELWDTTQPQGQRVEEKIMFYKELYERYKDHPKYKDLF